MKVIQLLLVLCLLFTLDCRTAKEVLKCAVRAMGDSCNTFVSLFKTSETLAYGTLVPSKGSIKDAVRSCLY